METVTDLSAWQNPHEETILSFGVFDGVHIGHRKVLDLTLSWARERGLPAGVVTFDRAPGRVLEGRGTPLLISLEHRLALLEELGFDFAVVLAFTKRLAETPAARFAKEILREKLRAGGVVIGYDQRFGRDREGDRGLLAKLGRELGFLVRSTPVIELAGRIVSSTVIREAIEAGRLDEAARMLGRPVSCRGTAHLREDLGRRLERPVFWLDLHHEVRPPCGVYAARGVRGAPASLALCSISGRLQSEHSELSDARERAVEVCFETEAEGIDGGEVEIAFLGPMGPERALAADEPTSEWLRAGFRRLHEAYGQ